MKVKAVAKRVGVSAIKARVVADSVRGMNAQDAVGILTYVSKGAALPVKKVIQSAIANAVNNYNLEGASMVISEIKIDKGPIANINAKRGIMLGKGGFARFDRKYCHITVVLEERSSSDKVKSSKVTKSVKVKTATNEADIESKAEVATAEVKSVKKTAKKASTSTKKS